MAIHFVNCLLYRLHQTVHLAKEIEDDAPDYLFLLTMMRSIALASPMSGTRIIVQLRSTSS